MIEPGETIDKYLVEAMVGEGGLARVYRVRHTTLGTVHALKLLAIRGGAVHRRLVREGRIQATLDHPHVVSVTDVIEHKGHPGLVMEYIEGLSLDHALQASGALSIDVTLSLSAQLFGAIAAAHARSVLHRDLKPANVMLEPVSGGVRAMVTDFGIARLMADTGGDTLQGDFLGTPGYMAPEQVSDPTAIDVRADVYSLGALLYCMVCGRPPFLPSASLVETLQAASASNFPPVHASRPDCPAPIASTIEAALAADPNERPATVEAFAARLFTEHPDLMEVVNGKAGVANITLQGARWANRSDSAHPITSAPLTGHPVGGSHFTAVPETFDTGAHTSDPSGHRESPPATTAPEPEDSETAAIHAALSENTQDVIRAANQTTRWPWAVAGVVAVLAGVFILRPSAPRLDPPAEAVNVDASTPAATPAPSAQASKPAPVEEAAAPSPTREPSGSSAPPPTQPGPPVGADATAAPKTAPLPTATPSSTPPGSASSEPDAGAPGSADPPPEAADPPPPEGSASGEPAPDTPPETGPNPAELPEPASTAEAAPEADTPPTPETTPPPPELPAIAGTWSGKYGGRPLNLRIQGQSGERIVGEMDVLAGPQNWKTIPLVGRLAPDGSVVLSDATTGWTIEGRVNGDQLVGTIRHPNLRKPMALRVGKR